MAEGEDGEDGPERHDKLKRTNTPHYTKGKRLYSDKEDIQEKFHEIMAKVGQKDYNAEDSDEQRVSINNVTYELTTVILNELALSYLNS